MDKLVTELKRINFIDFSFSHIENELIVRQFYGACKNNESLNEFYSLEETSQVGAQLTAQISHCFYTFLKYDLNYFLEKSKSFLRVLTKREKKETKSYDLVFTDIITGERYYLEVKLSQNDNSWQGSTSTTSKVDNFLLINFKIDREKKLSLTNNSGLFSGVFSGIFNLGQHKWSGDAKPNNHRTSFDFRINDWSIDNLMKNCIIKGGVSPKQKKYHLILEQVNYEIIK